MMSRSGEYGTAVPSRTWSGSLHTHNTHMHQSDTTRTRLLLDTPQLPQPTGSTGGWGYWGALSRALLSWAVPQPPYSFLNPAIARTCEAYGVVSDWASCAQVLNAQGSYPTPPRPQTRHLLPTGPQHWPARPRSAAGQTRQCPRGTAGPA
jgi:hypothetical protein